LDSSAIFNIIELDKFAFRERNQLRPVFLSNRNLEPHYGVDCVLRAFARIQQQTPEASLTVVGDGSQREALEKLTTELNLQHTSFTGRVDYEHYSKADVFLNASRIDNQPLSILEAFACGLPVVTTNAGGIPDIVTDQKTGLVVAVDDCKTLAERATKLLCDRNMSITITKNAREECSKYTWEVVCEQWLRLYREVAGNSA
jgi:glycosyltransferase involved in cell wall biosynthesis